jgi:hypothetical protein
MSLAYNDPAIELFVLADKKDLCLTFLNRLNPPKMKGASFTCPDQMIGLSGFSIALLGSNPAASSTSRSGKSYLSPDSFHMDEICLHGFDQATITGR